MPDAAVDAAQLPDRVCSRGGVTTGGGGGLGSGVWVWGCAHCGHIPSHCARITRLTRHRRLIHPRSHLTPTVIDHLIPPPPPPPPPPHNTNRPGSPRPKTPTITPRSLYHPCWALPVAPDGSSPYTVGHVYSGSHGRGAPSLFSDQYTSPSRGQKPHLLGSCLPCVLCLSPPIAGRMTGHPCMTHPCMSHPSPTGRRGPAVQAGPHARLGARR